MSKVFNEPAPAFQMYPNDHLVDIMELGLAERGAWITLVLRMWRTGPLSEERIVRLVGAEAWKSVRFLFASVSQTQAEPRGNRPVISAEPKRNPSDTEAIPTDELGAQFGLPWMENYRLQLAGLRAKNQQNGQKGGRPTSKRGGLTSADTGGKTDRFLLANPNETTSARKTEDRSLKIEEEEGVEVAGEAQDGVKGKDRDQPEYQPAPPTEPTPPATNTSPRPSGTPPQPMKVEPPAVTELITHFTTALGHQLDGTRTRNSQDCEALLARMPELAPGTDPVEAVKLIIQAAMADEFHARNTTDFGYLLRNVGKVIKSVTLKPAKRHGKQSAREQALANLAGDR